jgi:hypothetical protein
MRPPISIALQCGHFYAKLKVRSWGDSSTIRIHAGKGLPQQQFGRVLTCYWHRLRIQTSLCSHPKCSPVPPAMSLSPPSLLFQCYTNSTITTKYQPISQSANQPISQSANGVLLVICTVIFVSHPPPSRGHIQSVGRQVCWCASHKV